MEDDQKDVSLMTNMHAEFAAELAAADQQRDITSLHDGYGLLLEEMDEFWTQVKLNPAMRDYDNIAKELTQIMAVAWRIKRDVVRPVLAQRVEGS